MADVTSSPNPLAGLNYNVAQHAIEEHFATVAGGSATSEGSNGLSQSVSAGRNSMVLLDQTDSNLPGALDSATANAVNGSASIARSGYQFAAAQIDNALSASKAGLVPQSSTSGNFMKLLIVAAAIVGGFYFYRRT